ncbi:MAG: hydrogenase maturation nickel metallochaperone HypA [Bryobacteraceae bacterium]|jgi:Zn finger protein HypA/HybF involved in hydrogenase expression
MHEMGIAGSVIDAVRVEVTRRPGARATKVGLRIGEWCGVDVESLRFCLEVLVKDTELEPLAVDIDFRAQASDLDIAYLELEE